MDLNLHLWVLPVACALGFALNLILGRLWPRGVAGAIGVLFPAGAFGYAAWIAVRVFTHHVALPLLETHGAWILAGPLAVPFNFQLDQLSLVMTLIVTGVGLLIHIYALGYMWEEGGYYRFFAFFNMFLFFMLTLVLAGNFLLLFVGWEGVGFASYLLIGFYFKRDSAARAGLKAFVVNRIGDFAFLIGLFEIFYLFHSFDYGTVFAAIEKMPVSWAWSSPLTLIALLLFAGATGKSAQLPLYVWLPDAMEGPTPVSALIHAATMVTAGVYMICRSAALYDRAPHARAVVLAVGALTALFAAVIGTMQRDIKRILAYSTVSQLGYMFMACGVSAYAAGIFHLMTHAFFKALLFLAAGSAIHALHGEQDIWKIRAGSPGGLRHYAPITFVTFLVATCAISGIPGFSGFFSKDLILFDVLRRAGVIWWVVGTLAALLTSFYMFRALFVAFYAPERYLPKAVRQSNEAEPHESPWLMTAPLIVLAILAALGGYIGLQDRLQNFLHPALLSGIAAPSAATLRFDEMDVMFISTGVALLGYLFAYFFYLKSPLTREQLETRWPRLHRVVFNKFYVDQVYGALITRPLAAFSRGLNRGVEGALVEGSADTAGAAAQGVSYLLGRQISGVIGSYAAWVAAGAVAVLAISLYLGLR